MESHLSSTALAVVQSMQSNFYLSLNLNNGLITYTEIEAYTQKAITPIVLIELQEKGLIRKFETNDNERLFCLTQAGADYAEDPKDWIARASYVPRNIFAVVTRNLQVPDPEQQQHVQGMIAALIEQESKQISGLSTGYRLADSLPFADNGKRVMVPFKSKPQFIWKERYGKSIDNLFSYWMEIVDGSPDGDMRGTIDVMFIEPDPTHTRVVDAWHVVNMFPCHYEGSDGIRDLEMAHRDDIHYAVTFDGRTERDATALKLAQHFIDTYQLGGGLPGMSSFEAPVEVVPETLQSEEAPLHATDVTTRTKFFPYYDEGNARSFAPVDAMPLMAHQSEDGIIYTMPLRFGTEIPMLELIDDYDVSNSISVDSKVSALYLALRFGVDKDIIKVDLSSYDLKFRPDEFSGKPWAMILTTSITVPFKELKNFWTSQELKVVKVLQSLNSNIGPDTMAFCLTLSGKLDVRSGVVEVSQSDIFADFIYRHNPDNGNLPTIEMLGYDLDTEVITHGILYSKEVPAPVAPPAPELTVEESKLQNALIPIYSIDSANCFVSEKLLAPYVGFKNVRTSALKFDTSLNLLELSANLSAIVRGEQDPTDTIDVDITLKNLYLKMEHNGVEEVIGYEVAHMPLAQFNYSVENNYRVSLLNFNSNSILLKKNMQLVNGGSSVILPELWGQRDIKEETVRLEFSVSGKINLQIGDIYLVAGDYFSELVNPGNVVGVNNPFQFKLIGYELAAYRVNENRRMVRPLESLYPIYRIEAEQYFVPESLMDFRMTPFGDPTTALKFGKRFSLMGLAQSEQALKVGIHDETDSIDKNITLGAVYLKISYQDKVEVIELDLQYDTMVFKQELDDSYRKMVVSVFEMAELTSTTKQVNGEESAILKELFRISPGDTTEIQVSIAGSVNIETGEASMYVATPAAGVFSFNDSWDGQMFHAEFLGFDLKAYRFNHNRRS